MLREQAKAWAARVRLMTDLESLVELGAKAGVPQYPHLEMAGSWNVSQITAERWRTEAVRLTTALPRTLAMLETGELLEHQAKVLLHRTQHCTVEVAQGVETAVLPAGADLCPADLGKRIDRAVLRIEAQLADDATERRHADAAAGRRSFAKSLPDGMGMGGALMTAEQLVAWQAGLDRLELRERAADREAGVERTAEQRRADLIAALPAMVLAGTAGQAGEPWTLGPQQIAAQIVINVHVPVSTVLELGREPGSLDRYGAISSAHVRLLRPHSFRRVMVDSQSGRPVAMDDHPTPTADEPTAVREQVSAMLRPDVVVDRDEPQHDPSARLARLVDLRDVYCCGPGCSMTHTDRDHLEPHPTGATSARNLGRLSKRCHGAKHHGWHLTRHDDGSVTWTSPLRRSYRRPSPHAPPPRVDLWQDPPPVAPHPERRSAPRSLDDDDVAPF